MIVSLFMVSYHLKRIAVIVVETLDIATPADTLVQIVDVDERLIYHVAICET